MTETTTSTSQITENHRIMLLLIERSSDVGDGWRQVSTPLWRHVLEHFHPDLTEIDHENMRVRFTPEGITVMKYLQ
jgi:hypothetical protein